MHSLSTTTTALEPGYRPGERMVAGRPYCFNMRLLNEHLARERVATHEAADLTQLSREEIAGLVYDCHALAYEPDYPEALHRRLVDERTRRGLDSGGAPIGVDLRGAASYLRRGVNG